MNRELLIDQMCRYWRPDFDIEKSPGYLTPGMIDSQKQDLQMRMAEMLDLIIFPSIKQ